MVEPRALVRGSSAALELQEILRKPPSELLGVTTAATTVLAALGIKTIFDLGTSHVFASARAAAELGLEGTDFGRFGLVSGDLLADSANVSSLQDIPKLGLAKLRFLSSEQAAELSAALDIHTIRDLALWPPSISARTLVGRVVGSTLDPEELQTEELRPRMGQYPTERVYYTTLVMLELLGSAGNPKELTGSMSLTAAVQGSSLMRPAVGALLTFSQSWYSQGVTLGHMLHSLALAPGEATRIAVIDWSRRTRAATTETIAESEQLDSATEHARALSEVQQAVAEDFQAGGSKSSASSFGMSMAHSSARGTGLVPSLTMSQDESSTFELGLSFGAAESSSWSTGNRAVLGSLTQDVNDRTEQHSSSVRNRRAAAVREVSQSEHEQVSTRIIANYNHMHALTVQYYEVVQIYRTEAKLHRADRCLFVPIEVIDFSDSKGLHFVDRFRATLIRNALNRRVRSLLIDDTTAVAIRPVAPIKSSSLLVPASLSLQPNLKMIPFTIAGALGDGIAAPTSSSSAKPATVGQRLWDYDAIALLARIINGSPLRPDSDAVHVPDSMELRSISFDNLPVNTVRIDHVGAAGYQTFTVPTDSARIDLPQPVQMIELDAIYVRKTEEAPRDGAMVLSCSYLGRRLTLPAIPVELSHGTSLQRVLSFTSDQADRRKELLQHLQDHREYYTKAIFRNLDSATLALLLSEYKWNGRPLIEFVEPSPVRVVGNYLILRAPVDATEHSGLMVGDEPANWGEYLKNRGLALEEPANARIIPIPTGGVFAEAVLGRSNSAEKLDITRFWNWADSPIPLSPPEISAVSTGSRATAEDLKPGQLSSPVLNIVNPTSLPAPDSLSAVLGTLSTLNFRDQSGLTATQGLVHAGMQGALQAATEAGQLSTENLKTEAQKAVAMGQIAADIAKAAMGVPGGGGGQGISGAGARINHGRDMDQRGLPAPGGTRSSGTSSPGVSGTGGLSERPEVSGGYGGGNNTPPPSGGSHEAAYADQYAFGYSPDAVRAVAAPHNDASAQSPRAAQTTPSKPETTGSNATGKLQVRFVLSKFAQFGEIRNVWGTITEFPKAEKDPITEFLKPGPPVSGQKWIQCQHITDDGTFELVVQFDDTDSTVVKDTTQYVAGKTQVATIYVTPSTYEITVDAQNKIQANAQADIEYKNKLGAQFPIKVVMVDIASEGGINLGVGAELEENKTYKFTYLALTGNLNFGGSVA